MLMDAIERAQSKAPVDVVGLANDLGIRVRYKTYEDDISGELVRVDGERFEIFVNALDSVTRQRFTIAHELGHFIYHRDLIGDGVGDDRAYRRTDQSTYHDNRISRKEEREANRFAATILMPGHLIASLQDDGLSRRAMADQLQVSEHALAIRMREPYP